MGFTEILTIAFVILKCLGYLHWSWWLVFVPEYISIGFFLLALLGVVSIAGHGRKSRRRVSRR
jgi:hypothetical protein